MTLSVNNDPYEERVLVIKLSALGDFVQALGPMAAIRNHHKNAHITLLTTKPYEDLARKSGYFDAIRLDEKPKLFDFSDWLTLRKRLIEGKFTRVYDLQNNDRTSLYFRLFPRKKRPEWIGIAKNASHRNTDPTRIKGTAFEGHKQSLALAGINNVSIDDMRWIKEDLSVFDLHPPFVLLVPGCSAQHPQKRWPEHYYADIAQTLIDKNYQPVIIGTETEKKTTRTIKETCPNALDLTGKTSLFQIIALAHKAHSAIGNDTGPMHMIGPTNCPSIVLFSSHGDPKKHAPNGKNVYVLQKDNLSDLPPQKIIDLFSVIENNNAAKRLFVF
ncbi:MAG: glycosyltransferase family 9 protein [Alphaproteobacteria bacterium]|nr:glycosyltransferase family 9 protein [Alphaproteobacteria bacterium]